MGITASYWDWALIGKWCHFRTCQPAGATRAIAVSVEVVATSVGVVCAEAIVVFAGAAVGIFGWVSSFEKLYV